MAMTHQTSNRRTRRPALWIAAAGCGLWLLAQAVPADAQASRTRPGGGSSSSASAGGSSSSSSGGSSASSSSGGSSRSPVRVQRTRPPGDSSSGAPTVIDKRRPPERRSARSFGHHFHSRHDFGFFWPYRWGWYLGWDWWYPSWGYPYGYYGYGYPYPGAYPHRGGYPYRSGPGMGALDTDVWPARTQVWIDGRYVGFVDQFDGWPRYLWLPRGTYDVVFYLEGYQTLARQYTIYPGLVIDVEDRLEPGEAIHPTELAPKETPVRDARERAEREQRQAAAGEPEWRQRVRAEREEARVRAPDADEGGGWVFLGVRPADAAVYLDGEFVGTGAELSGRRGLAVAPGPHELSVVRPGYASQTLEFEIEPGGEVDLDVALEESV